jgi:radical SAM family protein/iron-sulfur cluster protein
MNVRNLLAGFIPPHTKSRLIELEIGLKQSGIASRVAKYFEPVLIKPYLARPHEIDIEVTSSCDADCIMCPRKAIRRKVGPMDLSLFKKIVDEAVALDVQELHLNGYGEISVLRNYKEYISYIRQKSRSIKINVNTNGMRMSEEMSRFYVESGVNTVNVTIDGATAATYESIRQHLKLDVVEGNVKRLIQIRDESRRKYPMVLVHMIGMPQNIHEADMFLDKWNGVADCVGVTDLVSRIGSVAFAKIDNPKWEKTPCFLLWSQMPVWSDGTVALCCDDWDGKAPQGNLNTSTIKEIWTSKKREGLRKVHLAGKAAKIPVCAGCKQPRQGPVWFNKGGGAI